MTGDAPESWALLDAIRETIHPYRRDPEDVITACVTMIAEILVMLEEDPVALRKHVATTKQLLDAAVDFKKHRPAA
jgi:hypothetical protein